MFVGIHVFKYIKACEFSNFELLGVLLFLILKILFQTLFPQISLQWVAHCLFTAISELSVTLNLYSFVWMSFWVHWEPFPYIPWRGTGIKCRFLDCKGSQCWNLPLLCFWQQQPLCKSDNMAGKHMLG